MTESQQAVFTGFANVLDTCYDAIQQESQHVDKDECPAVLILHGLDPGRISVGAFGRPSRWAQLLSAAGKEHPEIKAAVLAAAMLYKSELQVLLTQQDD